MATFIEAVKEAVKAGYCGTVRREPAWFAGLRRLIVDPDSGIADAANAFNLAICNSVDDAQDDLDDLTPFTGGQCPGVGYRVVVDFQFTDIDNPGSVFNSQVDTQFQNPGNRQGPITNIAFKTFTDSINLCITDQGGAREVCTWSSFPTTPGNTFRPTNITGISFTREDGQPDDCGDPPPVYPEPGPIIINPPNITFDDDDGNPFTVPITLIFAPVVVRANANISIPLKIDVGDIKLTGNFDLFPNTKIELFPDLVINRPGTPDQPDLTDPETGTDGQPEAEDENDSRDPIIAVVVRSQKDGFTRASEVAQDSLPVLFAPRLGNVSFFVTTGGLSAWTPPQPIQFTSQHLPCPSPYGARDVKVWWDAGWTGSFSPIRGKPLGEPD